MIVWWVAETTPCSLESRKVQRKTWLQELPDISFWQLYDCNCKVAPWSSNRNNGQTPRQVSLLLNNDHSWISHADVTAPSSESTGCHWRCQWWHADFRFGEFGCESQLWEDLVAGCLLMELRRFVGWSMANHGTMGCKLDMIWHDMTWYNQAKAEHSPVSQSSEVYLSCCSTERGLIGDS